MIVGSEKIGYTEWKEYLLTNLNSTVYHTPEWLSFLTKTFGYKPKYLFSIDECGVIDGFLPLMKVESKLTGNRIESLPFSHWTQPLGNVEGIVTEFLQQFSEENALSIQINAPITSSGFIQKNSFCTHILDLNKTKDELWKGLDRGSTRWAVNKSKKEGVVAELSSNERELREFYELNCLTKKELGVPCHPFSFFQNLFQCLGDMVTLYVSRYDDTIIGGGVMLQYNGKVIYGYGAAKPDSLKKYPYNAFLWKSIEDSLEQKCSTFDFGRTSHENTGLIQFKQKWGAQRQELTYSYYPKTPSSLGSNREGFIYKTANNVIRTMPLPLYKTMSDRVFKHFG